MKIKRKTKTEFLWDITEKYRAAKRPWPASSRNIAAWALQEQLWKPHPKSLVDQCATELAAAMREEFYIDPQGRQVRKKHAIRDIKELPDGKSEQLVLWVDSLDATHEQMLKAFQNQRRQVLGNCRQLNIDVSSYNDNNTHGKYIDMCFDFTDDLVELEQPTEYPGVAA